jgi:hypothetical protein
MSWQVEFPAIIRYVIGDFSATPTYTDNQLRSLAVTSAQLILTEVDFSNDYVVDVAGTGISPDPTSGVRDNPFLNLVSAKAACILGVAEQRIASGKGIKVTDERKSVDFGGISKDKKSVADSACKIYSEALFQYKAGNRVIGKAVMNSMSVFESWYPTPNNVMRGHFTNYFDGGY